MGSWQTAFTPFVQFCTVTQLYYMSLVPLFFVSGMYRCATLVTLIEKRKELTFHERYDIINIVNFCCKLK